MSLTNAAVGTGSGALKSVLKKASKVLTVCVEYDESAQNKGAPSLTTLELETLSMQIRKLKAAALWTSDPGKVSIFTSEQESAIGNFPGPCPVVFDGALDQIENAVSAGASAVVIDAGSLGSGKEEYESEVVWRVSSAEDAERVISAIGDNVEKSCFLVECNTMDKTTETLAALPKAAAAIASVDAMQPEDEEVTAARLFKKFGCASILVRGACVGDDEDVDYTGYIVEELTSKKSSEFNFSGLTGSANGHFGGVASSETSKWRRVQSVNA
eukprot:CAMPEP_0197438790 /NCGR_PEP_ID=MMETSP1175-20131217/5686_1 /TAXON_ID=1003142 /ORGANISM="Triceratium dubium, Strain CCMP147" /LENGTH=270 /DNA_ID=CAMNT_0042968587 /DNA_START=211 /DNA_END=1023 /DNA_ORIENTATION=+